MKNIKKVLCLCGVMAVVSTLSVGAETVNNPDMSTTIDNSTGTTETVGKVKVDGSLGWDSSDPGSPEPIDPSEWIKVSFPTEVIFRTSKKDNHSSIVSPQYTIKNISGRPVSVSVKSYSVSDDKNLSLIKDLFLKTEKNQVPLITKSGYGAMGELFRLDVAGRSELYGGDTQKFEFAGYTEKGNFLQTDKVVKLDSTMELSFSPLKLDGTSYFGH